MDKYQKQYYLNNKERIAGQKAVLYGERRRTHLRLVAMYMLINGKEVMEAIRLRDVDSAKNSIITSERWRKNNIDYKKKYDKEYNQLPKVIAHRKKIRAVALRNPKKRLSQNIASHIRISIGENKGGRHWEDLVDYTLEELKRHLEGSFGKGMTWENYGKWHIDHIIPIAAFNYEMPTDYDFKRCWALDNLKPMWADDNIRKSNKLEHDFQPSLKI